MRCCLLLLAVFVPVYGYKIDRYQIPAEFRDVRKPEVYAYQSDPMASVYLSKPVKGLQKMIGEKYFKDNYNKPNQHYKGKNREYEQPPYTVLQEHEDYEERFYPGQKWVCTEGEVDVSDDPFFDLEWLDPYVIMSSERWRKQPQSKMFWKLFKYISGVNVEGVEIPMTVPVSMRHLEMENKKEQLEMCFYLTSKYQGSTVETPTPIDGRVFVVARPDMTVYVRTFGGHAFSYDTWMQHRQALESNLAEGSYPKNEYYCNGYNSPHEQNNRRNEIWIRKNEAVTLPALVTDEDAQVEPKPVAPPISLGEAEKEEEAEAEEEEKEAEEEEKEAEKEKEKEKEEEEAEEKEAEEAEEKEAEEEAEKEQEE